MFLIVLRCHNGEIFKKVAIAIKILYNATF